LNWAPLTNALVVTNGAGSVTLTDTNAAAAQNFYRSWRSEMKCQAPTSKRQRSFKPQTSRLIAPRGIEAWCFPGCWCLALGFFLIASRFLKVGSRKVPPQS